MVLFRQQPKASIPLVCIDMRREGDSYRLASVYRTRLRSVVQNIRERNGELERLGLSGPRQVSRHCV